MHRILPLIAGSIILLGSLCSLGGMVAFLAQPKLFLDAVEWVCGVLEEPKSILLESHR